MYTVIKAGREYSIVGRVNWTGDGESIELVKIDRLDLYFAFLDPEQVVHERKIRLRGARGRFIPFEFKFSSERDITESIIARHAWRVTE